MEFFGMLGIAVTIAFAADGLSDIAKAIAAHTKFLREVDDRSEKRRPISYPGNPFKEPHA